MVENKYGLGSILSFSAKSVNPKILETILVGREKIVNQLENKVKNIVNDGLNHQVLIIGARGTGKTHIVSVLHHRTQTFIKNKQIKVAYFTEEEYGISGYLDFMVRILNAFIRWNEEDAEFLRKQLSILKETPSFHQEETIKRIINEYVGNKPLLILAENFNDILDALKKEGQSKLRNWLQQNERISIIATSQALSDDIGKEDKPFYGFFEEITLKPLSLEESYELIKKLAELEKKTGLIAHLENKGKSQVKAINTLVKGNHRLLITFYEFLKSDHLSNLSVLFIKTLNNLKPYYETFIRYQPSQQQKIIRFLALAKKPQKGVEIARECFIDQKSLSKQLSELSRKKLIEILPNMQDKRNKLYDIAEPLLRISIEIGEQKEGISALFIDFLALYYNQNELENQKNRFSEILKNVINPKEKKQYSLEIDARERALETQKHLAVSEPEIRYNDNYNLTSKNSSSKTIKPYPRTIKIDSKNDSSHYLLGNSYYEIEDFKNAIESYKKAIKINPTNENYFLRLAIVYSKNKNYNKAILILKKLVQINPKNSYAFSMLGFVYSSLKKYEDAYKNIEKAIKIDPKNPHFQEMLIKFAIMNNHVSVLYKTISQVTKKPYESEKAELILTIFINILKYDKTISVEKCLQLEGNIIKDFKNPKELQMLLLFIQTFRKVALEKKQESLYELPKEQRGFFNEEIIAFRKGYNRL